MKSGLTKVIAGLSILLMGLGGFSCSKEKGPQKEAAKEKPAGHEKMVEQYMKNMEGLKKIVAARVNGVDITKYDLFTKANKISSMYMQPGQKMTPEIEQKATQAAMDDLIFRELAFQEATRRKMSISPQDIDAGLQDFKTKIGTGQAYETYLKNSNMTEASLKKLIERELLFRKITAEETIAKIKVDEKMVRDAYAKDKKQSIKPAVLEVEDVVFRKGPDEAATMKKAKEVLAGIKKGDNDLTKLQKDGTILYREGEVDKKEYPVMYKVESKMKEGNISDVIKEEDGLHIVRVKKNEPSKQMAFEEVRGQIEEGLKMSLAEKKRQQWVAELKKNAKIEMLGSQGAPASEGVAGKR